MKPMVDISSSAGQEVSSAASPGNSGQAQSAPLQTADGISKTGTGSHRSHSCFPADGQVWWHGKKSLVTSWAPSVVLGWPSLGDRVYWGFSPKTHEDAKGQNISRSIPPCPKNLFPSPLFVSLVTATMILGCKY